MRLRFIHAVFLAIPLLLRIGNDFALASSFVETFEEAISKDAVIVVGRLASVQSFDHLPASFSSTEIRAEVTVVRVLKNSLPSPIAPGDKVKVHMHLHDDTLANVVTNRADFVWQLRLSERGALWGGVSPTNHVDRIAVELRRQGASKGPSNQAPEGTSHRADPQR